MKYGAPGLDPVTGQLVFEPIDQDELATLLIDALPARWDAERGKVQAAGTAARYREVIARRRLPDLGDPLEVGWTYLVARDDPLRSRIEEALRPLARLRGMADPARPLEFAGEPPDQWFDWMATRYAAGGDADPPHYVLIAGGPEQVPFHFQAVLDSAGSVGRVAFDDPADLEAYVEKVVRLETGEPAALREAVLFATDRARPDPTYYSRRFMAKPIADLLGELSVPTTALLDDAATAGDLLEALTTRRPALVYTVSHGAKRAEAPLDAQRDLNGAIVCAGPPVDGAQPTLAAADVPLDVPVAEGAVVFQFACWGGGTPAESDFAQWLGRKGADAEEPFVAALPQRLLAHPRGPIAFVGHVDLAWVHAFDDPAAPGQAEGHHPRLRPFLSAVETTLAPQPVGLGMREMNKRYDIGNGHLAIAADLARRGRPPETPAERRKLVQSWVTRCDAQNWLVLGDPAAYPRMEGAAG